LAVCAVFKNEGRYLLEWIAYHRVIGFDHFVLYDNESTDGGSEIIRSSWAHRCTTVIAWPRRPGQLPAYRHFIYNLSDQFSWVAFIDLDEFLLPLQGRGIRDVLRSCQGFSAVLAQWRVFGPSGWEKPPAGLMLENYVLRAPDEMPVNAHVKSIVKCSDVLDATANPHEFQVNGPVCNSLGRPVPNIGIQPQPCHARLVINHYVTRSREDWMAKISRGSAAIETGQLKYRAELFEHYVEISRVRDEAIWRFAPLVRGVLHNGISLNSSVGERLPQPFEPGPLTVVAHIQNVGDVDGQAGAWIGKRGGGRWIEGLAMVASPDIAPVEAEYRVVVGRGVASPWMGQGAFNGSRGIGLPIRGFAVRLTGPAGADYACRYSATFVDGSQSGPVDAGELCVAPTLAPLEALRIDLRRTGTV
jgi:hypothetical protein